jgi:hypothetical protein
MSNIEITRGEAQMKRAMALAVEIDDNVKDAVVVLANAKLEYQGGPFVVMNNIMSNMDEETIDGLPEPHSKTGNNPAWYKIVKPGKKTDKVVEEYFYNRVAESLPSVIAAKTRIEMLNRSMGDASKVNMSDIPDVVKNTTPQHRQAEIDRLNTQISTAKSNVASAFELYFQLKAFDDEDVKVSIEICYALDPNTGDPMDGQEGRDFKVEATKTPITMTSTIKGRSAIDTKKLTVGTFKKYDVPKAKEAPGGATFQSLEKTIAAGANQQHGSNKAINTLDTYVTTTNDTSEYLHRVCEAKDKAAAEAIKKMSDKNDDFFYNLRYQYEFLKSIVGDPASEIRYQTVFDKKHPAAA